MTSNLLYSLYSVTAMNTIFSFSKIPSVAISIVSSLQSNFLITIYLMSLRLVYTLFVSLENNYELSISDVTGRQLDGKHTRAVCNTMLSDESLNTTKAKLSSIFKSSSKKVFSISQGGEKNTCFLSLWVSVTKC